MKEVGRLEKNFNPKIVEAVSEKHTRTQTQVVGFGNNLVLTLASTPTWPEYEGKSNYTHVTDVSQIASAILPSADGYKLSCTRLIEDEITCPSSKVEMRPNKA